MFRQRYTITEYLKEVFLMLLSNWRNLLQYLHFFSSFGRFHAVLYGALDNIFYVFAQTNQEFRTAFWQ